MADPIFAEPKRAKVESVMRFNFRMKPEQSASIDKLMQEAGIDNDADFFRHVLNHYVATKAAQGSPTVAGKAVKLGENKPKAKARGGKS